MRHQIPLFLLGTFFVVPSTQGLDLRDAFLLAAEQDQVIAAARAEFRAVTHERSIARSALLPQLSATANFGCERQDQTTRDAGGNPGDNVNARDCAEIFGAETARTERFGAILSQALFDRAAWLGLDRAGRLQSRAELVLAEAEQELLLRVARVYFDVIAADEELRFALAERDAVTEQRELAEQRFEVGLSAITDVREAQARYDLVMAQAIEAAQNLFTARDALQEIINARPEQLARVSDDFETRPPEPATLSPWLERALQDNLALRIAEVDQALADNDIAIARAGHWPTLRLEGEYGRNEQPGFVLSTETRRIGLALSVPIYSGGLVRARTDQAAAVADQRSAQQRGAQRATVRGTRNAFQSIRTSRARVQALARAVESNRVALEAAEAGVEVGTRTAVDVLDAQQAVFGAQRDLSRARYDYLLAVLTLKRAAGTLIDADITAVNALLDSTETLGSPSEVGDGLFIE